MANETVLNEYTNLSEVDFSRYHTDELRVAIEDILSITGNLAFFSRTLFLVWITGPIVMPLVFSNSAAWVKVVWSLYGSFSFFFAAAAIAIFLTKRRLLTNVLSIVDIIFDTCDKVLDDLGDIKSRGVGMTAVTLVSKVDSSVIRPIVEGVLRSKIGFLSRPLLWMYKGVIGNLIQVIETTIAKMAAEEDQRIALDNESRRESGKEQKDFVQRTEDATWQLKNFIKRVHGVSIKTASRITKYAMIPSFFLSFVIFIIAILPALLAKIW